MARLGMDSMAPTKGHPDSACASLGLAMLGLLVLRREPSPAEAAPPTLRVRPRRLPPRPPPSKRPEPQSDSGSGVRNL